MWGREEEKKMRKRRGKGKRECNAAEIGSECSGKRSDED